MTYLSSSTRFILYICLILIISIDISLTFAPIIFLISKRTYYCCAVDVKVAIFYLFFLDFTILIDRNIGLLSGVGASRLQPIIFPIGSVDLKTSLGLVQTVLSRQVKFDC